MADTVLTPIDVAERFLLAQGWKYTKDEENFLISEFEAAGWNLAISLKHEPEESTLRICCDCPIHNGISREVGMLLACLMIELNRRLPLGAFGLGEENEIGFVHAILVEGVDPDILEYQIDRTIHDGMQACIMASRLFEHVITTSSYPDQITIAFTTANIAGEA